MTLLALLACSSHPSVEAPVVADAAGIDPSFDCGLARTLVEKAICADPELADLDHALGHTYRDALDDGHILSTVETEADWLARRDACANNEPEAMRSCIASAYTSRLRELGPATSPFCGLYAHGALDVPPGDFRGVGVVSLFPSSQYESLNLVASSVAANPMRARCYVELWTGQIGDELFAAAYADEDGMTEPCIARIDRTPRGINVITGEACQWGCGAAASWGGEYARVTDPVEQKRWEEEL